MFTSFLFFVNVVRFLLGSEEKGERGETARRTFRALMIPFLCDGLITGMYGSYAVYVLKKAYPSSDMLIAAAPMFTVVPFILSFPAGYFSAGRSKKPLFRLAATLYAAAGLGYLFVPAGPFFLPLFTLFGVAEAIKMPARNSILQGNFSPRERSRFLGGLFVFSSLANIAATFAGGSVLDLDVTFFHLLFPLAMALAILSMTVLSRIPVTTPPAAVEPRRFSAGAVAKLFSELVSLLRKDRYFFWFEVGFFLYGWGFMTTVGVLPIFYADRFDADYTLFGLTNVILNVVLLLSPLIGRWADRSTPLKLASIAFFTLGMYPWLLLMAPTIKVAFAAHVVFSLGMIGVSLAWNLGPIFFSGGKDASVYIGVHTSFVGLRALLAFPVAGWIKTHTSSFTVVFLFASALFLSGFVIMLVLHFMSLRKRKIVPTVSGRFTVADSSRFPRSG